MQRVVAAIGAAAGTYALYMTPESTNINAGTENLLVAIQLIYNIRHKYATLGFRPLYMLCT